MHSRLLFEPTLQTLDQPLFCLVRIDKLEYFSLDVKTFKGESGFSETRKRSQTKKCQNVRVTDLFAKNSSSEKDFCMDLDAHYKTNLSDEDKTIGIKSCLKSQKTPK